MKICTKCKRELSLDNFRWKNKSLGKKHSQCKDCQKKQEKQHYQECLQRKQSVLDTAIAQKIRNTLIVNEFKKCGCQKCGEVKEYLLDCHHIKTEEKINNICNMIKSASEKTLKLELEKCIVLCANCHREFHYLEKEMGISIEDYLKQY